MAIRFVRSAGAVHEPSIIDMYSSGVVHRNSVVELSRTGGTGVYPGGSGTRTTNIFGVCLDYAQGASDVLVRVIPFVPGQIWEADTVGVISTAQIGLKHQLYNNLLINNTSYDMTATQGVFLQLNVTGATTGSGKILGEFLRDPSGAAQVGGNVYY